MYVRASLLCLSFALIAAHKEKQDAAPSAPESGPMTRSAAGTFLGSWMETRRGRRFQAYRSIPYAQPPVGPLRFQPPEPILQYKETVDATEEGPACPQPVPAGYLVSEDCLMLNVYTPSNNESERLPVIVYLHPGGFYSMSARSDVSGPRSLLDQKLVLVTVNYRLSSLGFLSMGTKEAPGNNGMKDQVAALRWVRQNIAAFGGDPELVTLAGCSAGAVSAMLHMVSPMSKGLFHRAISISGSPITKVRTATDRLDLALKQAKVSNCPTEKNALYECLKTKTWQEVTGSLLGFFEFGYDPLSLWRPVVELDFGQERFLPEEPMDVIRQGRIHSVPFMVSMTRDEFYWKSYTVLRNRTLLDRMNKNFEEIAPISFILPRDKTAPAAARRLRKAYLKDQPLTDDQSSADGLGALYGDSITAFPVHRMANLMSRHSRHPVWYYMFDYLGNRSYSEQPAGVPIGRVVHHDDLLYLMTHTYRFPLIPDDGSLDSQMIDKMTAIWYNFAKYGDPNPKDKNSTPELSDLSWPAMTPEQRNYLQLGRELSIHQNLFEDRFKVWEDIYPIEY